MTHPIDHTGPTIRPDHPFDGRQGHNSWVSAVSFDRVMCRLDEPGPLGGPLAPSVSSSYRFFSVGQV